MVSTQAGPSRRRRRSSDLDDAMDGGRMRRSEVFATIDPREKANITRRFNELQNKTDGERQL